MKSIWIISFATLLVLFLSLTACQKTEEPSQKISEDEVVYNWDVKIKADGSNKELLEKIASRKPVSFSEITSKLIALQANPTLVRADLSPQFEKGMEWLSSARAASRSGTDQVKIQIEVELRNRLGHDLYYNSSASSLAAVITEGRMQCYSGTMLFMILNRSMGRDEYLKSNSVVILEKGHILPGVFKQEGPNWILYGHETTIRGMAEIRYGLVDESSKDLVVADADEFFALELLRGSVENANDIRDGILKRTSEKYKLPDMSARLAKLQMSSPTLGSAKTAFNDTPFSFGAPILMDTDVSRMPRREDANYLQNLPVRTSAASEERGSVLSDKYTFDVSERLFNKLIDINQTGHLREGASCLQMTRPTLAYVAETSNDEKISLFFGPELILGDLASKNNINLETIYVARMNGGWALILKLLKKGVLALIGVCGPDTRMTPVSFEIFLSEVMGRPMNDPRNEADNNDWSVIQSTDRSIYTHKFIAYSGRQDSWGQLKDYQVGVSQQPIEGKSSVGCPGEGWWCRPSFISVQIEIPFDGEPEFYLLFAPEREPSRVFVLAPKGRDHFGIIFSKIGQLTSRGPHSERIELYPYIDFPLPKQLKLRIR